MAQNINRTALQNILNNREEILAMAKGMNMAELIALDAKLDTAVFGKPLGLMGEKANIQNPLDAPLQIDDVDDQTETCEVRNA